MRRHLDGEQIGVGQREIHLPVMAGQSTNGSGTKLIDE